jgi:GNAT superfamily N-acetyltransferase
LSRPDARKTVEMKVRLAVADEDIRACFPVMRQLRPRYSVDEFLAQVRRQEKEGYQLAMAVMDDVVVAVAGYRMGENLAWGRYLYVDDLVTDSAKRSSGHGARLLGWLEQTAREAGCAELHLDSGVQRFDAHRFYLVHGMKIASHHFSEELKRPDR